MEGPYHHRRGENEGNSICVPHVSAFADDPPTPSLSAVRWAQVEPMSPEHKSWGTVQEGKRSGPSEVWQLKNHGRKQKIYQVTESEMHSPNRKDQVATSSMINATVGFLSTLPSPAARSDSSIVYAGSFSCLHRRLWTLLRQWEFRATSVS
jgi:hypothetical protein